MAVRYVFGVIFLLLSIWQFIMAKRAFTSFKQHGEKGTSPFIMLGLWSGVGFAFVFLIVAFNCFFTDFSSWM